VIVLPEQAGPIAPPHVREGPLRTTYVLDPRWLDRLSPDDMFLRHWCDVLTAREPGSLIRADLELVSRELELV